MNVTDVQKDIIWNPLAWAADCRAQACFDTKPEVQAAFIQLAEEFEVVATEFVGLIATVEALGRHQRGPNADVDPLDGPVG